MPVRAQCFKGLQPPPPCHANCCFTGSSDRSPGCCLLVQSNHQTQNQIQLLPTAKKVEVQHTLRVTVQ